MILNILNLITGVYGKFISQIQNDTLFGGLIFLVSVMNIPDIVVFYFIGRGLRFIGRRLIR